MVAVAPGAAAPPDGPSGDGSLESLFEGRGEAGARAGSAGRARSGPPEARTTTIDLSTAADPVPRRRGVVPLRRIVGARPPSGRWQARARRSARIGGWVAAAATVSAGLVALWVLLFTTVSGGDVWLGRPLTPTKHDEHASQQGPAPASPGAGSLRPTGSTPPKPSATAATKAATPSHTSGKSRRRLGDRAGRQRRLRPQRRRRPAGRRRRRHPDDGHDGPDLRRRLGQRPRLGRVRRRLRLGWLRRPRRRDEAPSRAVARPPVPASPLAAVDATAQRRAFALVGEARIGAGATTIVHWGLVTSPCQGR